MEGGEESLLLFEENLNCSNYEYIIFDTSQIQNLNNTVSVICVNKYSKRRGIRWQNQKLEK